MRSVSAERSRVPVTVPLLSLWHDAHDPSAGSTGANSTLPVMFDSDCARIHVMRSALKESDPLPLHVPERPAVVGWGGGAGVEGGGADGAAGVIRDSHPRAIKPAAARTATVVRIRSQYIHAQPAAA
jgi:hypothetical protein